MLNSLKWTISLAAILLIAACSSDIQNIPNPNASNDGSMGLADSRPSSDATNPDATDGNEVPTMASYEQPHCAANLLDLRSTPEVSLVEGPLPCGSPDSAEFHCGVYKVTVGIATNRGPADNPSLDDMVAPLNMLLTVRAPKDGKLCDRRWVAFDAGGSGQGYGPFFGKVPPGHYVKDGDGYGDDLIRAHNERGSVTVDLSFDCNTSAGQPCADSPYGDWAPHTSNGSAWYLNLNGSGFVGAASRARALYEWIYANNGGQKLCSHSQSSGTGRMILTLTRFQRENLFDAVVFDGGPTFAYTTWACGINDGPLGNVPSWYGKSVSHNNTGQTIDCALTTTSNEQECTYHGCRDSQYDEAFANADGALAALNTSFPQVNIGVVLGAEDSSGAWRQAMLWLGFVPATPTPPLTAKTLTIRQGYCEEAETEDSVFGLPCETWDGSKHANLHESNRGYDSRLVGVGHSTTEYKGGMEVVRELMFDLCSPTPSR